MDQNIEKYIKIKSCILHVPQKHVRLHYYISDKGKVLWKKSYLTSSS